MFRKISLSIAMAGVCTLGNMAWADGGAASGVSQASGTRAELAAYTSSYSSQAPCPPGGAPANVGFMQTPQAMAYGQTWGGTAGSRDCDRFYHYPYVFYPQNYRGSEYYQSSDSMYNRYPPEMQIPVYNRHWHNYYPSSRRYHWGHHFILDVF